MAGQFFKQILNWLAHDAIVNSLTRSKTFQKFAITMDTFLHTHKDKALKTGEEVLKDAKLKVQDAKVVLDSKAKTSGFQQILMEFQSDLKRDLEELNKPPPGGTLEANNSSKNGNTNGKKS